MDWRHPSHPRKGKYYYGGTIKNNDAIIVDLKFADISKIKPVLKKPIELGKLTIY